MEYLYPLTPYINIIMFTDLFPIKIYRTKITGVDAILQDLLPLVKEELVSKEAKHRDLGPATVSTFNTNNQLHHIPLLANIVKDINSIVNNCWKEFNYYPGLKTFISEMWLNETLPGGISTQPHNHSPYPLVGVLYLKLENGMGNIIFENPNNLVVGTQPHNWTGPNDINGGIQEIVDVETGDIIIFPGWLRHFTETNHTTENRYVIAFNIGCTGDYPISTYLRKIL
jgi:uncharacterized protein (TIGR02466 family)